jgi:hypothetical protein
VKRVGIGHRVVGAWGEPVKGQTRLGDVAFNRERRRDDWLATNGEVFVVGRGSVRTGAFRPATEKASAHTSDPLRRTVRAAD